MTEAMDAADRAEREQPYAEELYWRLGFAVSVGFFVGLLAAVLAVFVHLWVGRWVLSALVGLLALCAGAPVSLYLFASWSRHGAPLRENTWVGQAVQRWLQWVSELFGRMPAPGTGPQGPGTQEVGPRGEPTRMFGAARLAQRTVREVMVPRPDVVGIPADVSVAEAGRRMLEHGISRAPVYVGDLETTEGVVHIKDVFAAMMRGEGDRPIRDYLRPVHFVPETKPLAELLREMQEGRFHLAVVSDEYGCVTGIVTLEDLLEEVVGRIADEFDQEIPEVVRLPDGTYRVQATLPIVDLNELLGTNLPHASWNTVGGLVFGLAGRIPEPGAVVELEGVRFVVERVQGRRIVTVLVQPLPRPESSATPAA